MDRKIRDEAKIIIFDMIAKRNPELLDILDGVVNKLTSLILEDQNLSKAKETG